jgi:hypothetical protein
MTIHENIFDMFLTKLFQPQSRAPKILMFTIKSRYGGLSWCINLNLFAVQFN